MKGKSTHAVDHTARRWWAVKVGRHTGIFGNWLDMKDATINWPGWQMKVFYNENDARAWMGYPLLEIQQPVAESTEAYVDPYKDHHAGDNKDPNVIEVYVHGKYNKATKKTHIALWCKCLNVSYELAKHVEGKETTPMAARFMALEELLRLLENTTYTNTIRACFDTESISKWMRGKWQTKVPEIIKLKTSCRLLIDDTKYKLEFASCTANEKVFGMGEAVRLTERKSEVNTFDAFIRSIEESE